MTNKSERYDFLTDAQAIGFIKLMAGELHALAERRGFRTVLPALASVELNALGINGSTQLAPPIRHATATKPITRAPPL